MKKIFIILVMFFIPNIVFAKSSNLEETFKILSSTTKYYKTIIKSDDVLEKHYLTYEITEEEYDNAPVNSKGQGVTETTYKKLTTSILSSNSRYRYKTELSWKNMPSTRSYDVIAIGNLSNVSYYSNLYFSQYYCLTNGSCNTLTTYYPYTSNSGVGATFKLPEGSLSVLKQTLYYDVAKNTASTITYQAAYGDYSHAIQNISLSNALDYYVNTSGIVFNNYGSYFDSISPAVATWSGNW